jgi:hypothetical protein
MAKEKIQWQKGKYNGKRKRTKRQTMIYNIIHKELKIEQHESHKKFENELRSLGRISSFYSTSGIRQVTLGKNLVISQTTLWASQNGRSKFFWSVRIRIVYFKMIDIHKWWNYVSNPIKCKEVTANT